jgi:hypothetical protein
MPRLKRSSTAVERAERRLASVKSINPNLELSKELSVQTFSEQIEMTRQRVEAYNTTLSLLDANRTAMMEAEKALAEITEKMLLAVALEYGKDSTEYEMAGGTRKSMRKRPTRKANEKTTS